MFLLFRNARHNCSNSSRHLAMSRIFIALRIVLMMLVNSSNLYYLIECRDCQKVKRTICPIFKIAIDHKTPTFCLWHCVPLFLCLLHHHWEVAICKNNMVDICFKSGGELIKSQWKLYWRLKSCSGRFWGDLISRRGFLWLTVRAGGKETRHGWRKQSTCKNKDSTDKRWAVCNTQMLLAYMGGQQYRSCNSLSK